MPSLNRISARLTKRERAPGAADPDECRAEDHQFRWRKRYAFEINCAEKPGIDAYVVMVQMWDLTVSVAFRPSYDCASESVRVAGRDLEIALVDVVLVGAQIAKLRHSRIRIIAKIAHYRGPHIETQTGPAVRIDLDDSAEVPCKSRQAGGLVSPEPGHSFLVVNETVVALCRKSPSARRALPDAVRTGPQPFLSTRPARAAG